MEKKQTAVEWLAEKIYKEGLDDNFVEQAKQMEKKQMKKSWGDGFSFQSPYKNFEQYYNETYNK